MDISSSSVCYALVFLGDSSKKSNSKDHPIEQLAADLKFSGSWEDFQRIIKVLFLSNVKTESTFSS